MLRAAPSCGSAARALRPLRPRLQPQPQLSSCSAGAGGGASSSTARVRRPSAPTTCSSSPLALLLPRRRHVAGVRRLLRDFFRAVHPDLTPTFPEEALRINQRSLSELNAYVDGLEQRRAPRLEDGPEASRELRFFRAFETRSGRTVPGRVRPMALTLPTVPVLAEEHEREYAAALLIRDAEVALESTRYGIPDAPPVDPLFTQKGAGRTAFDRLWWQETRNEMVRGALFAPDERELRRREAMKVFARKYEFQLVRKYSGIQSNKRRRRKLALVTEKVEARLRTAFGTADDGAAAAEAPSHGSTPDDEWNDFGGAEKAAGRVLQSGFNPDLVFVAPDVSLENRREAIRRVCGMNLASDAEFWLLGNLWKAMRSTAPAVPLVVAKEGYKAHIAAGFMQVPWNFEVMQLCDLLEEHLDAVRAGLARRRAGAGVVPLASSTLEPEEPWLQLGGGSASVADGLAGESESESDSEADLDAPGMTRPSPGRQDAR